MSDKQPWNTLGYVEKCLVASKASLNASALSSEGNNVKLMNCGIDTMRISTLGEYLADKRIKEGKEINLDLRDDMKLAKTFVVPVTLPNGQEIEVIVNQKGQDMACMYRDEAGNEKSFQLTPRMKREIENMTPDNLREVIGEESFQKEFLPDDVDEFAEKVSKDELVPKNKKQAAKMAGIESKELEQEKEQAEKEIPEGARDTIAKICSEHDLDITALKEVMEVRPEVVTDNLPNTGIQENSGNVYCLRFRDAGNLQGRVVMVQGDNAVDKRENDDYMNDYMNEHKGEKKIYNTEDEHDKVSFTDIDGNTTVSEISKEPRDLSCTEKEQLQEELQKLEQNASQIMSSDMSLEQKNEQMMKINNKRLSIFKDYGISVPSVESEIEADLEIGEEIENNIEDEKEQEEEEQKVHLTPEEEAMKKRGY